MSKNKKITPKKYKKPDFERTVMSKVSSGKIVMKPRLYFIAGSVLSFIGLIGTVLTSVFSVNLIIFLVKKRGLGVGKLSMVLDAFPFWIPVLAILGIALGIYFLKKYDFTYKKNFIVIVFGFVAAIIISALAADSMGLNNLLSRSGSMRGFYQKYSGQNDVNPHQYQQGRFK